MIQLSNNSVVFAEDEEIEIIFDDDIEYLDRAGNTLDITLKRVGSTTTCELTLSSVGTVLVDKIRYRQIVVTSTNYATTYGTIGDSSYHVNGCPGTSACYLSLASLTIPTSVTTVRIKANYNGIGVLYVADTDYVQYSFNSTRTIN